MILRKVFATAAFGAFAALAGPAFAAGGKDATALEKAVTGEWRTSEAKDRDVYRHPVEALAFWGLKPGMKILEVQPGGGWWTEILAPYARLTKGEFDATASDLGDPNLSEGAKKGRADFAAKYGDAKVYGKVNLVNWGSKSAPLTPNRYDFVLVARAFHGWVRQGIADAQVKKLFDATKPGGILAIEQHRAPDGQDLSVWNGYLDEAYVISAVEKAGFKLDAKSEINANAKDTKDHPFGVWTLPPVRQSASQGSDPNFDHSKYDAIGESDRMTLRFVKPRKK